MIDLRFEDAIMRIDEIMKALSDGQLPLQKALEQFGEAAELIAFCNKTLESAELTIEEYKKTISYEDNEI